ncbi:hypothetical protein C8Q79DRAFT_653819 [Trametes meyenii]|nr:hypothetical protein C8Q79DRAFT_653819 [Trametes meyenii]
MAIDLLQKEAFNGNVQHLYRRSPENFVWIFIWVLCCYKDGKLLEPLPEAYHSWTLGNAFRCRRSKIDLLHSGFADAGPTSTWVAEAKIAGCVRYYLR